MLWGPEWRSRDRSPLFRRSWGNCAVDFLRNLPRPQASRLGARIARSIGRCGGAQRGRSLAVDAAIGSDGDAVALPCRLSRHEAQAHVVGYGSGIALDRVAEA